jgi:hypothetical protein
MPKTDAGFIYEKYKYVDDLINKYKKHQSNLGE